VSPGGAGSPSPAGGTPGGIGAPLSRLDGPAKVTGAARYAADASPPAVAHAVLVGSTIANGRIRRIDVTAAAASPGVLAVLTHLDMPRLSYGEPPAGQALMPMQGDEIHYEGQHVAVVVAETLDQAARAASRLAIDYERQPAEVDFRQRLDSGHPASSFDEPDTRVGDVDAALAAAPVRLDRTYSTADRHHHPIEPSATIADWQDGKLTLHDATQWVWGVRTALARALAMPEEDVRVVSQYTGGGFGSKGYVWPHQLLAAVAARQVGRPVKLVLTRAQTFTAHGYQPASEQRLALGASRDGRLLALRHESFNPTSIDDDYVEFCAIASRTLYACPAIETRHRVVHVHRGVPTPMRAPHEGIAMVGLECAMDELAYELGIDPLELRLRNYAERHPTTGKPFSCKGLRECYRQGAERFGWARRPPRPRSIREGQRLVGWGMAGALMPTYRFGAKARVTLERDGGVLIEAGTQEIGTGVRTILPQIAADVLGLPPARVRVELGDTTLPETGGTFGSSTTMGVGSAVFDAAGKLERRLDELAGQGGEAAAAQPAGYGDLLAKHGLERLAADGSWSPPGDSLESDEWAMHTFGAVFVEVEVDEQLPVPHLRRCLGVYSAGRIVNPKTARSQVLGGMTWGLGQALLERSEMDRGLGRYLSKNLAGYLVPVNADVPALEAWFVDEVDEHASPIGAKGIGELGAVGVGPAIANAVFHATGVRVRELPIRPERLL
jgi:xanthine dehydrogenase YagR molybdenum-binding subunit